jgi:23S rRNA (uracil1939-C5)-methyltransferase
VRDTIAATPLDEPWGYRHKVHFVFGNASRRGPLVMGHFARGSRRVVPVRVCPVHDPRGNAFAFRLRDECARAGVSAAAVANGGGTPQTGGTLRHLMVRVGARSAEMMATLVVTRDDDKRLRAATRRALAGDPAPQSLHLNLHPRPDAYIFGRETRRLVGPERMREDVGGVSFLVSPTAFFQTNVRAAEVLVRLVLDAVPTAARVLDLYAGAGLFAIPMARRGNRVIAIEESRRAVDDGAASLRLNRIDAGTCRFVARQVESAIRAVSRSDAETVVLDPPRDGCAPDVLDDLFGRLRPERAVYVSCNPEVLARDLATAGRHGYQTEVLQPVDMFPHTAHVETVGTLMRRHTATR